MIRTLRLMLLASLRGIALGWQNAAEVLFAETNVAFLTHVAQRERDVKAVAEKYAAEERAAGKTNVWASARARG